MSEPSDDTPPDRPVTRRQLVALIGILLLAAALRVYRLDEKSFWFDEFWSVAVACGRGFAHLDLPANLIIPNPPELISLETALPLWKIWYGEPRGHMPPLYAFLLRLWVTPFGVGPISARAFSVVTSVAAVATLFLALREWSGTSAALWGALLMAVAGPQITYAQEARNYALLLLTALGAAAALARIERRGPTRWRQAALALCVAAMGLTHYFAVGAVAALVAYAALRLRGPAGRAALASFAAAGVLWLALGAPIAWRHAQNVADPQSTTFLADPATGHATRTAVRTARLPVRYFTEPMTTSATAAAVGGVAFALAVLLPLRRRDLLPWGLWLPLTVLPVVVLDLTRRTQHLEFIRYTLLAAPAVYALVAAALSTSRGFVRHVPPLLATLACLLALPSAYEAWWKADWRQLAYEVNRNARTGDVIVFWRGDDFAHYPNLAFLHTSYYAPAAVGPIVLLHDPPDAPLLQQLRAAPGILLVSLSGDGLDQALPGAQLQWLAFEPGAGKLWRATWPDAAAMTATSVLPTSTPAASR